MEIRNTKSSRFIVGPDSKRLLLDAYKGEDYIYLEPSSGGLILSATLFFWMPYYLIKLLTRRVPPIQALKSSYLSAIIRSLASDIVISAIDNNIHLSNAARLLHKRFRFIVIQNGTKFYNNQTLFPDISKIFIPELICFGEYDKQSLCSLGAKIGVFHICGSLFQLKARTEAESYRSSLEKPSGSEYGICLVSEDFTGWDSTFPGIEEASGKVASYCLRYCKEHHCQLAIALKNEKGSWKRESELRFLNRYIDTSDSSVVLSRNTDFSSSYTIAHKSSITVGMASSLLVEVGSLGGSILICDFYGESWSLGASAALAVKGPSITYSEFEDSIRHRLPSISDDRPSAESEEIQYFIASNKSDSVRDVLDQVVLKGRNINAA